MCLTRFRRDLRAYPVYALNRRRRCPIAEMWFRNLCLQPEITSDGDYGQPKCECRPHGNERRSHHLLSFQNALSSIGVPSSSGRSIEAEPGGFGASREVPGNDPRDGHPMLATSEKTAMSQVLTMDVMSDHPRARRSPHPKTKTRFKNLENGCYNGAFRRKGERFGKRPVRSGR